MFEKELENCRREMDEAEDTLVGHGFSEEHWLLIRKYVLAAILHNQFVAAKALYEQTQSSAGHSPVDDSPHTPR